MDAARDSSASREPSAWVVLNSPIVIAILTSGFLAALGATYNNRIAADAQLKTLHAETLATVGEVRLRSARLEAIDIALLRVKDANARKLLGGAARAVIQGTDPSAVSDRRFEHRSLRLLADEITMESHMSDADLQRELALLDSSDMAAADGLRVSLPLIRSYGRDAYLKWTDPFEQNS